MLIIVGDRLRVNWKLPCTSLPFSRANTGKEVAPSTAFVLLKKKEVGGASYIARLETFLAAYRFDVASQIVRSFHISAGHVWPCRRDVRRVFSCNTPELVDSCSWYHSSSNLEMSYLWLLKHFQSTGPRLTWPLDASPTEMTRFLTNASRSHETTCRGMAFLNNR